MSRTIKLFAKAAVCAVFAVIFCQLAIAQGSGSAKKPTKKVVKKTVAQASRVKQINIDGLRKLLKPGGKPLLINFWATWCDPCREEFPELVKIDEAYRGKIDFLTVSLDDLADINKDVPKFLREMKAEMPAYLLKTPDESAAITLVSNEWNGNLPLTILFTPNGDTAYLRKGKIRLEVVSAEIDKLLAEPKSASSNIQIVDIPLPSARPYTFEQGVAAAQRDVAVNTYKLLRYGLTIAISKEHLDNLRRKYSITVEESGCVVGAGYDKYVAGYNSTTKKALQKKFGVAILPQIEFAY